MALNLSRNTKVFVSTVNGVTAAGGNITGLSASPGGTNNGFAVGDVLLGGTSDGNGTLSLLQLYQVAELLAQLLN